jgi:hypothetical protein
MSHFFIVLLRMKTVETRTTVQPAAQKPNKGSVTGYA